MKGSNKPSLSAVVSCELTHQFSGLHHFTHQEHRLPTTGQQIPTWPVEVVSQGQTGHTGVQMHLHDVVLFAGAFRVAEGILLRKDVHGRRYQVPFDGLQWQSLSDHGGNSGSAATLEAGDTVTLPCNVYVQADESGRKAEGHRLRWTEEWGRLKDGKNESSPLYPKTMLTSLAAV